MISINPRLPKTREGAARQWNALIHAYRKAYSGGGAYGFDWPTLSANAPEVYTRLKLIAGMWASLPSRPQAA